jgi:5'-nucleotidase
MIRPTRFQAALLVTLSASISSLAGCSDSTSAPSIPLRIFVTNDDGVGAEGIDFIVEALRADPNNEVTVCAPLVDQSGSGDKTDCGTGNATDTTTQSDYPATAVDGCPADAVNYALDPANGIYAANRLPHVVISGINQGQNVSAPIATSLSGTVGAAKTAARDHGIPALATSQGSSTGAPVLPPDATYDFDSGATAVLDWLADHRAALAAGNVTTATVDSINTPTCTAGEVRSLREVPLAADTTDAFKPQDCESTLETPQNDTEAFINGFNALSPVPAN